MSRTDFDLTRIEAFIFDIDGVLSPSTVPMDGNGVPQRMVNIKDGYAMQLAVRHGYLIAIITGADTPSIATRYRALGINEVHLKASVKLPVLRDLLDRHGISPDNTVYVGDDIPDLPCMQEVGLAVAPADAAVEIKEIARYISPRDGGYGVARDIIRQVMIARGDWMDDRSAFGW
ncbi:MAG: HAD hydrolase family protein [Muribaculaceae bacterium]|nr:HAD hydrolase family protein [Muribaculaceae bacterium]MDE6343763.1 HAD hydrolase family protein [Muribaculaceae bacterium]